MSFNVYYYFFDVDKNLIVVQVVVADVFVSFLSYVYLSLVAVSLLILLLFFLRRFNRACLVVLCIFLAGAVTSTRQSVDKSNDQGTKMCWIRISWLKGCRIRGSRMKGSWVNRRSWIQWFGSNDLGSTDFGIKGSQRSRDLGPLGSVDQRTSRSRQDRSIKRPVDERARTSLRAKAY